MSEIDELEDDIFETSPITDSPASPFDTNFPLSAVTAAKKPRRFPPETKAILQSAHMPTRWPRHADISSCCRISGRWPDEAPNWTATRTSTEDRPFDAADSFVVHPQTLQSPSRNHSEPTSFFCSTNAAAPCQPAGEWGQYNRFAYFLICITFVFDLCLCQHAPHPRQGAVVLLLSMRTSDTASSMRGSPGSTLMVQRGMLHFGTPISIISPLINCGKQMTTGTLKIKNLCHKHPHSPPCSCTHHHQALLLLLLRLLQSILISNLSHLKQKTRK